MNKDTYCYQGLLFFEDGEDVKIFDAESGEELIEHTLDEYQDEIELPELWLVDSPYYIYDVQNAFAINGRNYRKTIAGEAYGCGMLFSSYGKGLPMFVSTEPDFVKYTTDVGGAFEQRATCSYRGKTWYISGGEYGFNYGDSVNPATSLFTSSDTEYHENSWSNYGLEFLQHIYES